MVLILKSFQTSGYLRMEISQMPSCTQKSAWLPIPKTGRHNIGHALYKRVEKDRTHYQVSNRKTSSFSPTHYMKLDTLEFLANDLYGAFND